MVRHIEDEIDYYYDSHSTEEDLMGETAFHAALVRYLVEVLSWLFQGQSYAIHENLNIYLTSNQYERPVAPDIAVFKEVAFTLLRSWLVGKHGPAPQVVFEIASEETWTKDLDEKPAKYAQMGAQEYFAYDPNEPPLSRSRLQRLFGWQLASNQRIMLPMTPASNGALWSPQLESWLVPDGVLLRLYDRSGQRRLTGIEAESQRAELQTRRAEVESWRAEMEAKRAETEAKRAEAEAKRNQVLEEKLRSLGVDPDQLL